MGPIRNLLDRIRERRMERLSSRQGLFPRLRNLINPLDSQGMMDRAQGTRVGGSLAKPLTYDRRRVPDATTPTATPTGKPAGKAPSIMEQDMQAVAAQKPKDPNDPMAYADHLDRQADVLEGQATTSLRGDPLLSGNALARATRMRDQAASARAQAMQRNNIKADMAEVRKAEDERTGLAGAARSMAELQKAIAEGKTTPLMAASIATDGKFRNRDTPPSPAEYQQTYAENLRQFVGPSFARATFSSRKGLTPDSPVYGELRTAFANLPDADRTQALQTYVAPHLLNGYVSEGAAELTKQFGRQPTEDEMARLNQDGMEWTEGQIAKLGGSIAPPSNTSFPETGKVLGDVEVVPTIDKGIAGALNLAGQAAQSLAPAAQRFLRTFMAPQPSASAAPAAAPMAPPVAQPIPAAPVAPRRPVPTYPNGQPRKMPTPIPLK